MITTIGSLVGRPWIICSAILVIAIGYYADFAMNKAIATYQDNVKAEKEKAQEKARIVAEEQAKAVAEAELKAKEFSRYVIIYQHISNGNLDNRNIIKKYVLQK